jgi:hypothetical protein
MALSGEALSMCIVGYNSLYSLQPLLHFYDVVEYLFNSKGFGQARHLDLKVV